MARTRTVTWLYRCDADGCTHGPSFGPETLTATSGDPCSTFRGTVIVDQADADAHARQAGWSVGKRILCPVCTRGGAS